MKNLLLALSILLFSATSFTQYSFFDSYGELFSFGAEISRTASTFNYVSDESNRQEFDTTLTYKYVTFSPGMYMHFPIYLEKDYHQLYANFNFLFTFNASSSLNDKPEDSFGMGFGLEGGATYFYGLEYGLGFFGSLLGTYNASFDPGLEIAGPSLRLGVQIPVDEHLLQVYLKTTYNLISSPEVFSHESIAENAQQTFRANHVSLGVIYRGMW